MHRSPRSRLWEPETSCQLLSMQIPHDAKTSSYAARLTSTVGTMPVSLCASRPVSSLLKGLVSWQCCELGPALATGLQRATKTGSKRLPHMTLHRTEAPSAAMYKDTACVQDGELAAGTRGQHTVNGA
jgi:hypothetical protein